MRKFLKARLIYERLEGHFKTVDDFIRSGLTEFWGYSTPIHEKGVRGLRMFFYWRGGADVSALKARIDEGVEWLGKLMASGQWSVHMKPRGEGVIGRKDLEGETSLTVELRATLAPNLQERYELQVYDDKTNDLLSRRGIYVNERAIYLNYEREAYRLSKQYRGQALREKLKELKEGPIYSQLDQSVLSSIDLIVAGV